MRDSDFTYLLRRASDMADRTRILLNQVNGEFERRFGINYNAIDDEALVDSLDYGIGDRGLLMSASIDEHMDKLGYPRIDGDEE